MLRRSLLHAGVALLALTLGAGTASAVLITEWDYETQAGFFAFAPAGGTGLPDARPFATATNPDATFGLAPVANPAFGLPTELVWGTPTTGGQSSFSVTPSVSSIVTGIPLVTNGGEVLDLQLTHGNFPVADFFDESLTSATLLGSILLQPLDPAGAAIEPPTTALFFIQFIETFNEEPCAAGSPPGNPCNDIFVLLNPESLSFDLATSDFIYTFTVRLEGVALLTDAECIAAGAGAGCFGFSTVEGQENTLTAFLSVDAVPVPGPSTLALLGLGLALAGLRSMRSRKLR